MNSSIVSCVERIVDPLLGRTAAEQVHRLVLLACDGNPFPELGIRIHDRRFIGEGNRGAFHLVQGVDESTMPQFAEFPDSGQLPQDAGVVAGGHADRVERQRALDRIRDFVDRRIKIGFRRVCLRPTWPG